MVCDIKDLNDPITPNVYLKLSERGKKIMENYMYGLISDDVVVARAEYNRLLEDQKMLRALEAAGVDNWEGYDEALRDV